MSGFYKAELSMCIFSTRGQLDIPDSLFLFPFPALKWLHSCVWLSRYFIVCCLVKYSSVTRRPGVVVDWNMPRLLSLCYRGICQCWVVSRLPLCAYYEWCPKNTQTRKEWAWPAPRSWCGPVTEEQIWAKRLDHGRGHVKLQDLRSKRPTEIKVQATRHASCA